METFAQGCGTWRAWLQEIRSSDTRICLVAFIFSGADQRLHGCSKVDALWLAIPERISCYRRQCGAPIFFSLGSCSFHSLKVFFPCGALRSHLDTAPSLQSFLPIPSNITLLSSYLDRRRKRRLYLVDTRTIISPAVPPQSPSRCRVSSQSPSSASRSLPERC